MLSRNTRRTQLFFELLKNNPHSLFSILDFNGNIIYANPAILELGQYSENEIIGQHILVTVEKSEYSRVKKLIQKIVNEELPKTTMVKMIKRDGSYIWLTSEVLVSLELQEIYLISHNMTDDVSKYLELQKANKIIEEQAEKLKRKEIALMEVIQQLESDKLDFKNRLTSNISSLILPTIAKLHTNSSPEVQKEILALETYIQSVGNDLHRDGENIIYRLTAKEHQICTLIKKDMSSKDIALVLHLSPSTIETHRRNIRKKLGLTTKGINLKAYLQ